MPARVTLADHLPLATLEQRYRTCRDPGARSRWHMLWLIGQGQSSAAVARLTGCSDAWVRTIVHRYNDHGLDAIGDGRRTNHSQPRSCRRRRGCSCARRWRRHLRMAGYGQGRRWRHG